MKFRAKQLQEAIEHLRYTFRIPMDTADIEVSIREEDISADKLVSCMTLFVTYEAAPGQYDKWKGMKVVKHTLEIFPESEGGRDLHVTTEESYSLPAKKD